MIFRVAGVSAAPSSRIEDRLGSRLTIVTMALRSRSLFPFFRVAVFSIFNRHVVIRRDSDDYWISDTANCG